MVQFSWVKILKQKKDFTFSAPTTLRGGKFIRSNKKDLLNDNTILNQAANVIQNLRLFFFRFPSQE